MTDKAKYLWLDLETTGLDPRRDHILECAAVITTADLRKRIRSFECVLRMNEAERDLVKPNDYVLEMHTKNGLWSDCERSKESLTSLHRGLLALIEGIEWADEKPVLAGATVHFDRGFLKTWCTGFESKLHHRHLDVSSLKLALLDTKGEPFAKAEAHRAMADVDESLEQARMIYAWLQASPENRCANMLLDAYIEGLLFGALGWDREGHSINDAIQEVARLRALAERAA